MPHGIHNDDQCQATGPGNKGPTSIEALLCVLFTMALNEFSCVLPVRTCVRNMSDKMTAYINTSTHGLHAAGR